MDLFPGERRLQATAWVVGERIDSRELDLEPVLAASPLSARVGDGLVVLFRYGVVVVFQLGDKERAEFFARLAPHVVRPLASPASDDAVLRADLERGDAIDADGVLVLADTSLERLQVVAQVLARSALLALYEREMERTLSSIEGPLNRLRHEGKSPRRARSILRQVGDVLVTEMRMVGRAEVGEKPEMLWERPDLDRLYVKLAEEYELQERHVALSHKLDLLARTHTTFLELLQNRRSLHVEWYIVILILVEIVILLYEMFG